MILKSSYTRNAIFLSTDLTEETINTVTKVFWQKHITFLRDLVIHQKEEGKMCQYCFTYCCITLL